MKENKIQPQNLANACQAWLLTSQWDYGHFNKDESNNEVVLREQMNLRLELCIIDAYSIDILHWWLMF